MPSVNSYGEYLVAARRAVESSTASRSTSPSRYEMWYQEYTRNREDTYRRQVDRATSGPEAYVVSSPSDAQISPGIVCEYSERRPEPAPSISSEDLDILNQLCESEPTPVGWSVRPQLRRSASEVYHSKGVSPFKLLAIKESEINGGKSCV